MNLIYGALVLLSFAGLASAESHAATFGVAFMDINPDRGEVGFYQIFAVSTNVSTVTIQSLRELSHVEQLNGPLGKFYNSTHNWNELNVIHDTRPNKEYEVERFGVTVNADSGSDVHVYGVKSDKGTTDSFMVLPLTENSKEFFIASWNCSHAEFFGGLQVAAPLEDTCVEIWTVDGDNYQSVFGKYMANTFDTYTFTANSPGNGPTDITGYFVNSSKPINVYGGHACAFVPEGTFFCDHIVEQIPPVSELGKMHIVPPIIGRNTNAGYVVRVVSAYINTTVNWESADSKTKGSKVVTRGHFVQFQNPLAAQVMKVDCDKPCLVMLYNPGRNAVSGQADVTPTDPFMMHIAPTDHYDTAAGFATPSFSGTIDSDQVRLHFNNQLTIITKTDDTAAIMFDGQAVTTQTQWRKASNWGYSYAAFPVTHGAHFITVTRGSAATFGAYSYGHSLIDTSSSAYGMTVGFHVAGKLYGDLWEKTRQEMMQKEETLLASDCKQERILSGSAVAQYPSAASPLVMTHPIELGVNVNSGPMSSACRDRYMLALTADLKDRSRLINEMICNGSMCPYMSGAPGSGIPVNQSAILTKHVVFVAIDTASLTNPVSFDVDSTGGITTVYVKVPYTGIMDTTAETFAKCRVEVRAFLRQFVNWPRGIALLPAPSGCPQIIFTDTQFSKRPSVCSLV